MRGAALTVALVFTLTAQPSQAEREWNEVTIGNVRIVSALNAAETEKVAADVELYFEAAKRVIARPHIRPLVPLTLLALDRRLWLKYVDPSGNFRGLFQSHPGSVDIVVNASTWNNNSPIVFHELTHLVLRQSDPARALPAWYHEGNAELLSTIEVKDGKLMFGRPSNDRWSSLKMLKWIPLEKVLTTKFSELQGREEIAAFYAQSWLMVHQAIFDNPARNDQLRRYRQLLVANVAPRKAFEAVFGSERAGYEKELSLYARGSKFKYAEFPLESLNLQTPQAHKLSESDALDALGGWFLTSNRVGDTEREFLGERAKSAPPESVAALQYANALILVESARKFYDVALQLEPDNLEVLLAAAGTFKALPGNSEAVRRGLESALQRDPNNSWIAAALSDLYRPLDLLKARDYMERALLTAPSEKSEDAYVQELNRIGSEIAAKKGASL